MCSQQIFTNFFCKRNSITIDGWKEILSNCQSEDERKRTAELIRPQSSINLRYYKSRLSGCNKKSKRPMVSMLISAFQDIDFLLYTYTI